MTPSQTLSQFGQRIGPTMRWRPNNSNRSRFAAWFNSSCMKCFRLLLLAFTLFTSTASAHQDRILTVQPDGSIPEIPAPLGPVSLKISGLGSTALNVQFRSGAHVNVLPDCATRLIRSKRPSDVFVTGSWYHNESVLPYYVSVQFRDSRHAENQPYNASLTILFNLRTAEIIEIKRFAADRSGNDGQHLTVDIPNDCILQLQTF